jgi:hypothetical protein
MLAPEELPVVAGLAEIGGPAALRGAARHRGHQDPLGFGLGVDAALIAPVAWIAVTEVARRFGEDTANGMSAGVKAVWHRIRGRHAESPRIPVPLSRDQLTLVHRLVVETATRRGLSQARATQVADAVVTRLALDGPAAHASPPSTATGGASGPSPLPG